MLEWTSVVQVIEHGKRIDTGEAKAKSSWYCSRMKRDQSSSNRLTYCQIGSPLLSLSIRNEMRVITATTDVAVPVRIVDAISLWMRLKQQVYIGDQGQSSTIVRNTPLGCSEGWVDPTQLPEKCNSNGNICSRTRAEANPKHTQSC